MIVKKPRPGSKYRPEKDSRLWSQIIDVVNAYSAGRLTKSPRHKGSAFTIKGITNRVMAKGDIAAATNQGNAFPTSTSHPKVKLEDVDWHTNIANIVIAQSPAIAIGQAIEIEATTWTVVNLSESVSEANMQHFRYAMPNPEDPVRLKAAASGIYEIVFYLSADKAVVNTMRSQPLWRYELTEDWNSSNEAEAKLFDIDYNDFTVSKRVTITDTDGFMDDQEQGDRGMCVHTGNKFHAIQAVC